MNRKKLQGFTLIEVLIVIVIVAILAAIGSSTYSSHITKTKRAEAKEALTRAATLQERYFFKNSSYSNNPGDLGFIKNGMKYYSTGGNYVISVVCTNACASTYTLVAVPAASGRQVGDGECTRFALTNTMQKTASGSGTDSTRDCW